MTPLDQICTTAQRIRDRADERDMAHRELKGFAEAIQRMEQDVVMDGGGTNGLGLSRSGRKGVALRPAVHLSALGFWSLAAAVVLATWGLAVLLEEPAGKPTPPYYKTFTERLKP